LPFERAIRCGEEKSNRTDRALARYQSMVVDYPGSPLVPAAKRKLAELLANSSAEANKKK